jgi:hypothetical protein
MNFQFLTAIACSLSLASALGNEEEWRSDPLLYALRVGFKGSVEEYRSWLTEWKSGDRVVDSTARSVNRITEGFFLPVTQALMIHPNEKMLKECLMFLALEVPAEFDDIWSFSLIEIRNVDADLAVEVDEIAKRQGLASTLDRAMSPSHKASDKRREGSRTRPNKAEHVER